MHFQFPLDYWNNEAIQNTLASFGRVILWENDRRHLARLLVRARVTNLQDVPHFILIIDGEEFHGESWMVQCEILEQHMLGGGGQPTDEEPVPQLPINGQPPMFDFIRLGHPGQGQDHFHLLDNVEHDHEEEQLDGEGRAQLDNLEENHEVMQGEDA
jgi:hypothetical protein